MSDHGHYCPFLNRSDARCSTNFSLERLNNTYDFCFGQYNACPVYLELLVERRLRRAREAAGASRAPAFSDQWRGDGGPDLNPLVVQLTHGGRPLDAALHR